MSIFEVCDTSNDECCFPIGYFGTLERAKKEIRDKMLNGFNISTHTDDHEKIEVFELSIGRCDKCDDELIALGKDKIKELEAKAKTLEERACTCAAKDMPFGRCCKSD